MPEVKLETSNRNISLVLDLMVQDSHRSAQRGSHNRAANEQPLLQGTMFSISNLWYHSPLGGIVNHVHSVEPLIPQNYEDEMKSSENERPRWNLKISRHDISKRRMLSFR